MTDLQQGILALLKSAVSGEPAVLPDGFNWQEALRLGKEHQISALLDYGLLHTEGLDVPKELRKTLENELYTAYTIDLYQRGEIERISKVFEQEHIRHMFLKGSVLKKIYPKSEMRRMGDIDILIANDQIDGIETAMQSMGFVPKYETPHEWMWQKSGIIHVELHKCLVDPENRLFASYYRDPWERAIPAGEKHPNAYVLSDEDFFLYLFIHFTKHIYVQGVGIQHMLDFWVYQKAKRDLDMTYIRAQLDQLRLIPFFERVTETLQVWFEGAKPTDRTELLTQKIFSDGVFGNTENWASYYAYHQTDGKVSRTKPQSRLLSLVKRFFPCYEDMRRPYPVLRRRPWLMPLFWTIRPFDILLRRRNSLTIYRQNSRYISKENILSHRQMLKELELDFEDEQKEPKKE